MAEVAAIITALAGAGVGVQQARATERQAERAARRQATEQRRLETELAERAERERVGEEATRARAAARRRQRLLALGQAGRRATILTSPLGLPTEPATGRKTLLGV